MNKYQVTMSHEPADDTFSGQIMTNDQHIASVHCAFPQNSTCVFTVTMMPGHEYLGPAPAALLARTCDQIVEAIDEIVDQPAR